MSLRSRTDTVASTLTTMQVLVVACGKTYLAVPADIIRGIVESAEAIHARIISLFGVTCGVTDLAGRLGLTPSPLTPETRIVLCGEHRARQAWRVDRVLGLTDVNTQRIVPLPPHFGGLEQGWFMGLFLFRETAALVVNSGWLLSQSMDAPEAQLVAAEVASEQPGAFEHVEIVAAADSMAAPVLVEGQSAAEEVVPEPVAASEEGPTLERPVPPKAPDGAETASIDILENLVLEESKDAEDSQIPWAET